MVQLVECLPGIHNALDSRQSTTYTGVQCILVTPALVGQRKEDQRIQVILDSNECLRPS